jgi:quinol monooxygenase YgiN
MAAQPTSVTVTTSFTILPHHRDVWLAAWGEVARMAAGQLACRQVHLLQDRSDSTRCVLLSEWDTIASFNRFVRESGLLWLDDALTCSCLPHAFTIFKTVSHPLSERVAARTVNQGLVPVCRAVRCGK